MDCAISTEFARKKLEEFLGECLEKLHGEKSIMGISTITGAVAFAQKINLISQEEAEEILVKKTLELLRYGK